MYFQDHKVLSDEILSKNHLTKPREVNRMPLKTSLAVNETSNADLRGQDTGLIQFGMRNMKAQGAESPGVNKSLLNASPAKARQIAQQVMQRHVEKSILQRTGSTMVQERKNETVNFVQDIKPYGQ